MVNRSDNTHSQKAVITIENSCEISIAVRSIIMVQPVIMATSIK